MKQPFMGENFLLANETARHLYHDIAESMPIIDYHCHLSPREIYENKTFQNLTQVWLGGDHYKWRLMRANGIPEECITGTADDKYKYHAWVKTLELAAGNPLYHWSHLELQKYFGFSEPLTEKNMEQVWKIAEERLPALPARTIIEKSRVTHLCTTDDPADDLRWHRLLKEDTGFSVRVLPAWRPDRILNVDSEGYCDYVDNLSQMSGIPITSYSSLKEAISIRMDFFAENGCCVSDHGLDYVPFVQRDPDEVSRIFQKALRKETITAEEKDIFRTAVLLDLAKEYAERNWVMQIHFGVIRNTNTVLFQTYGPDAGADGIGDTVSIRNIYCFLDELNQECSLPKTILYSLNPNDNAAIDTMIGCFQNDAAVSTLQHGAAWWFNDHKKGMLEHMEGLASGGMLANFVGMLTDSRSFFSYARHDYFRRILCGMVGTWVEAGEFTDQEEILRQLIEGICYNNALDYFGLDRQGKREL